ncbi:lactonase family protein [Streptomyces albus subsp. chlorinus]|uniref:lactonase family protein n=1 Tax=Streptomyces albus TaxID=1888 RepID=UPI0015712C52|nr:lactonase family protein [Streptomyces albus]NSC25237.1 lactonase family protein [Streptomyces albus subsp. chlorinus]
MTDGTERGRRAYIGSFTSDGGRGITTAELDAATGALTALHHTGTTVTDPSFLALSPGGGVLYAVSETDRGGVAALSLDRETYPVPLGGTVPVDADGPTHLTVAGGHLYTANYTSGSVTALPLRADGSPGGNAVTHQHHGQGPVRDRQEGPHAHAVVPDPSGQWLLVTDLGTDSVWVYDLRGTGTGTGTGSDTRSGPGLRLHREVPLRSGTGPRHLAFAVASPAPGRPGGAGRALVVNELDSTVTACRWDAGTGELVPLGETRLLPPEAKTENHPSALALSPDGRFAWAANRGHDSVTVLDLTAGELPERVTTVPCGGHWPRDLAVHPSGRRLYAANERSGDVTWFDVDPATGIPHRAGSLAAPAASCVVFG